MTNTLVCQPFFSPPPCCFPSPTFSPNDGAARWYFKEEKERETHWVAFFPAYLREKTELPTLPRRNRKRERTVTRKTRHGEKELECISSLGVSAYHLNPSKFDPSFPPPLIRCQAERGGKGRRLRIGFANLLLAGGSRCSEQGLLCIK